MVIQNTEVANLPNIGKVLSEKLRMVGIMTTNDLQSVGCENAFIKLKTVDSDLCINALMALEGAIQGIRWHNLDEGKKLELKEFFKITTK